MEDWVLGTDKTAYPYHLERYNITLFATGTKVIFIDHNNNDNIVDTGLTITDDVVTEFDESHGDIYLINPVDGLIRIMFTEVVADAAAGATQLTIHTDGAARLSQFSITAGNIRIGGIDYSFSAVDLLTGNLTVTPLSNAITSSSVAFVTQLVPNAPKGSKVLAWKDSLNIIGVENNIGGTGNSELPQSTLYYSDFSATIAPERIIDFAGGKAGSELVGHHGVLQNIIATKDFVYLFKDNETYFINTNSVDINTGSRFPQLFSSIYGCPNTKSATVMENVVVFLTSNKRIIRTNIIIEGGSTQIQPDETFDSPIRELLDSLDDDQTEARVWYQTKRKELHIKCRIQGSILELIYDNDKGIWCPPDTNKFNNGFFEIKGEPYCTSDFDDTIWRMDSGTSDDGADIESIVAFGEFEHKDSRTTVDWGKYAVSGGMTKGTVINWEPIINGTIGTTKVITDKFVIFAPATPIAANPIGSVVLGGSIIDQIAGDFDEKLAIYPAKARRFKPILRANGDGHFFFISSWSIELPKRYSRAILTTR
jgi:hypothetical protein